MSVSKRRTYLEKFLENMRGRDAKGIQNMRITIRKKDWLEAFKSEALTLYNGQDTEILAKAIENSFNKEWKEISDIIKKWYSTKSRATTWKKQTYKANQHSIIMKITNSSAKSTKWYNNAVVSLKRPLNKWAKKKTYVKRIIGEHGKELERSQQSGGQMTFPGQGNVVNRPGSAGNNMQTSLVKAMENTIQHDDWWCDFLVMAVQNYLHAKINSRVDKRKTKNSIFRNHTIEYIITPSPPSKQTGAPDVEDQKEYEKFFNRIFFQELQKEVIKMKKGGASTKAINAFTASSPDIFDEFSDFGDDKAVEIMEREARRSMQKANARMTGVGPKTKTKISFGKQLKNIKAEKKIGKKIEVMRKGANQVKTSVVAKQNANPPLSKISKNKRAGAMMNAGFKMDKEGLLIKELINRILPRAIQRNMGSPRLNNQSGRFAKSAKVDNVIVGPRGGLYIGYTYPQSPYGVFEPGHGKAPWANQYRDPRHIIGKSIREIVATNMGGQVVSGLTREFE